MMVLIRILTLLILVLAAWFSCRDRGVDPDELERKQMIRYLRGTVGTIQDYYVNPERAETHHLVSNALAGMVANLDPWSTVLHQDELPYMQDGSYLALPAWGIDLARRRGVVLIQRILPGSPAASSGLLPGDLVQAVNRKKVETMFLPEVLRLIRNIDSENLHLRVYRPATGEEHSFVVAPCEPGSDACRVEYDRTSGFARVVIERWDHTTAMCIEHELHRLDRQLEGVLLDLRLTGGLDIQAVRQVASLFVGEGTVLAVQAAGDKVRDSLLTVSPPVYPMLPMVVLFDQTTSGSGELLAAGLKAAARINSVGSVTPGMVPVTRMIPLNQDLVMVLTAGTWLTPDGTPITGEGIEPAHIVDVTEEDMRSLLNRKPTGTFPRNDPVLTRGQALLTEMTSFDRL